MLRDGCIFSDKSSVLSVSFGAWNFLLAVGSS